MVSFRFRSFWRLFFVLWPPFGLCLLLCFVRFCFYTGEFGYISLGCREFIETRRPVRFSTCASARILLFGSQKNEDFSLFSLWFMSGDGWLRKFEFYWFKWKLINGCGWDRKRANQALNEKKSLGIFDFQSIADKVAKYLYSVKIDSNRSRIFVVFYGPQSSCGKQCKRREPHSIDPYFVLCSGLSELPKHLWTEGHVNKIGTFVFLKLRGEQAQTTWTTELNANHKSLKFQFSRQLLVSVVHFG